MAESALPRNVCFRTYTSDGYFPLLLLGVGDGGPGTVLREAWLTLPGTMQSKHVQMMHNFQPTKAVTEVALVDQLPNYLQEAMDLVCNPRLRTLANELAVSNCLSNML